MKTDPDRPGRPAILRVALGIGIAFWCLVIAYQILPLWSAYPGFLRELFGGLAPEPSLGRLAAAGARHLLLLLTAGLLALVTALAGNPLQRFFRLAAPTRPEETCLAVPLGWTGLGLAFFGLALTGLFFPPVLTAAAAAFLGAGVVARRRDRPAAGPPGTAVTPDGDFWRIALLVGAPLVVFSPLVLSPPIYVDFFQRHAAAPEHFLKFHKFATEGVNMAFHGLLTSEMLNAVAVFTKQDALCPLIGLIPFLAGLGAGAAWLARVGSREAAALAAGLALSLQTVFWTLGTGKNDLAVAGMALIALVSQARGRLAAAALFWGAACATKKTAIAFAGIAWLFHEMILIRRDRLRWRPDAKWIAFGLLAPLPWFVKSWLIKGDPVWPALSGWFPGALLDDRSRAALGMLLAAERSFARITLASWGVIRDCQPVLLMALPFCFIRRAIFSSTLRSTLVMTAAAFAAFPLVVPFELDRYRLPLIAFWCFPAALALDRLRQSLPGWARWPLIAGIAVVAWAPAAATLKLSYHAGTVRYLSGSLTTGEFLARALTTRWEAQEALRRLPGVRTVILTEEHASYRWAGKPLVEGFHDRKPTWELTREAPDLDRLLVRLRQRNVTHIVLNFIVELSISGGGSPYIHYPWTSRQLELLREFMRRHTEIAVPPAHCDQVSGGFYIYRVRLDGAPPGETIYYLPGTQEVIWRISQPMLVDNRPEKSREMAIGLARQFPDVLVFQMQAGFFSACLKDWRAAYEYYSRVDERGMIGDYNLGILADAAIHTERYDEAVRVLERARDIFLAHRGLIDDNLALSRAQLAIRQMKSPREFAAAARNAQEAFRLRPGHPAAMTAMALLHLSTGRFPEAEGMFREIVVKFPSDHRLQQVCRKKLAVLKDLRRGR